MTRAQEAEEFSARMQRDLEASRTPESRDNWPETRLLLEAAKIIDPAAFAPTRRNDENMSASDALGKARRVLDMFLAFIKRPA